MRGLAIVVMLLAAAGLGAQDATVTYVEGDVDIQTEGGATFFADFGDELGTGDRVITMRSGEAELELASGGVVNVSSDTVFIIGASTGSTGERSSRLSAAVGSFSFRFNALVGNEPRVGSTTSAAGVRGTELRVLVGSDGTTRYEVIEGLVEIEDAAETVVLGAEQGVEVAPGRSPGNVFAFLEQPIDYSVWNAGLISNFLDSPLSSLRGLAAEMDELIEEIERRGPEVDALFDLVEQAEEGLEEFNPETQADERQEYFLDTVMAARRAARDEFVDLRFVVLSALSLEQHVISRLAAEMEARYVLDPDEPVFIDFKRELGALRSRYESVVVPWLVPSDL